MGQVLTRVVKINGKAEFTKLMDRISAKDNIFDIRRKEYLSKDKFVLNYASKDMVAENTGLFRTTSFARFQTVFTLLNDNEIQIATEYGFIGSASTMIMDIIDDYVNNSPVRYNSLKPKPKQRIGFVEYFKRNYRLFFIEFFNNYYLRFKTVRILWQILRFVKRIVCLDYLKR